MRAPKNWEVAGFCSADDFHATTEYVSGNPVAPATGLKAFCRAGARRLLATIGPTGQDTRYQPSFAFNRIATVTASNGAVAPALFNHPAITAYTASTGVSIAATTFFNSMTRVAYPGGSTVAATLAGFRTPNIVHMSSTPNKGGFHWVWRGGIAAGQAGGGRGAIGLFVNTAALAVGEPFALTNFVGFGWGNAEASIRVMSNDGTGNAVQVADLGATDFSSRSYGVNFYQLELFNPSGGGAQVWWSAKNLNNGVTVTGATPITTDLPAVDTLLGTQSTIQSSAAATIALHVQHLHIETDN